MKAALALHHRVLPPHAGVAGPVALARAWAVEMLATARVARLATADRTGQPLVVPVCFALIEGRLYSAVDAKPKRTRELRRLRNVADNPRVSLVVGLMGTVVAGSIGTAMGILAGYVGRWVDQVIMRVTDVALKATDVRPGMMIIERLYGMLELHSDSQADVRQAGRAILDALNLKEEERIKPEITTSQVIRNMSDYHTQLINRTRHGDMIVPGQSLYVMECAPAGYAAIAANEAEKAANINVLEVRAFGSFGRVYRGADPRTGQGVAIKVLRQELATAAAMARFNRETHILAQFRHRHIVPIHDAGEALGLPFCVMDFLEGETLEARLARGPLGRMLGTIAVFAMQSEEDARRIIALGAPPALLGLILAFSSSLMMSLTHYGTGTAPIIFGSGYVTLGEWWKAGWVMSVVNLLIWIVIGGAWWKLLGYW